MPDTAQYSVGKAPPEAVDSSSHNFRFLEDCRSSCDDDDLNQNAWRIRAASHVL